MINEFIPLHDALFNSIKLNGKNLHLEFCDKGKSFILIMYNIIGFQLNNFLSGNIINNSIIYDLPLTTEDSLPIKNLINKYCEYYKNPCLVDSIGNAFVMDSSYGAELIAVFLGGWDYRELAMSS